MPESQFAPFNNGIFKENVIPEPESATQAIYGDLDSVVQAVFTNQSADPASLLARRTPPASRRSRRLAPSRTLPEPRRVVVVRITRPPAAQWDRRDTMSTLDHMTARAEQPEPALTPPKRAAGHRNGASAATRSPGFSTAGSRGSSFCCRWSLIFGAFSWYPIVRLVMMSFQHTNEVITTWVGFQNFSEVLTRPAVPDRRQEHARVRRAGAALRLPDPADRRRIDERGQASGAGSTRRSPTCRS